MSIKSLVINPGSTSTKIGVFEDETLLFEETLRHTTEEIARFASIADQKNFRKDIIVGVLKDRSFDIASLNMVVGRGGLLKPIVSGTYTINDALIADLNSSARGEHASNLGGLIAREIADSLNIPSYIVDPVVVDELCPAARLSGVPELPRVSIFHALNQKAIAKRYARESGRPYDELNLIVVHLGGGVSVGAHSGGKVIDVFNALDGDGAFSPERAGAVPAGGLIRMCYSGQYSEKEMLKKITGNGGLNAYLHTNDMRDVEKKVAEGDAEWTLVREAFMMQVAKDIGSMACVLKGKIDQILITGGIAYNKSVIDSLNELSGWIAPITVYPGEDELLALVQGALRVMNGEEEAQVY
ncbi:MAG: butyrate kinase [Lachnospiraceae bacterium]|jgi:butyrate kinase|nr:butyrate kinase [Lachnospiraceae bacterium]